MNTEAKVIAEKVLNRLADGGAWQTQAAKDAYAWAKSKDRATKYAEVEALAAQVYAAKGRDSRGRKSD